MQINLHLKFQKIKHCILPQKLCISSKFLFFDISIDPWLFMKLVNVVKEVFPWDRKCLFQNPDDWLGDARENVACLKVLDLGISIKTPSIHWQNVHTYTSIKRERSPTKWDNVSGGIVISSISPPSKLLAKVLIV